MFGDGTPVETPRPASPDQVKDDGIDVIAWQPSPDGLAGTHYLLGQSASGDNWKDKSIKSDSEHYVHEGKLRVYRSRAGGNEWEALTKGLPQKDCYVNVLRDAMCVDSLDSCGVYFGTTGGQVYLSPDAGDNWSPIVRDLPAVLSVEVQTLQ